MTNVSHLIPPTDPARRAYYMAENARRGHDLLRGASSIEEGYLFTSNNPSAPLLKPPPVVLRETRPSGWFAFCLVVFLVFVTATTLAVVAR